MELYKSDSTLIAEGQFVTTTQDKYEELWEDAESKLKNNGPEIDEYLNNLENDQRLGVSLIIRPSKEIGDLLKCISDHLGKFAPEQYYYETIQYHVTVATFIEARESFSSDDILLNKYQESLSKILSRHRPFRIHFRGIGGSKGCIFAQGFFADDSLNSIREDIKEDFAKLDLKVEERYPNTKAHITFIRFRSKNNVEKLANEISGLKNEDTGFRDCELGIFQASELELVINDWYMREEKVRLIKSFKLQ